MREDASEYDERWGARLRHARLAAGLSQKRLGELIDLDGTTASARINRYELGVHRPDLLTVERLARALDVSMAYLYADSEALADLLVRLHRAPAKVRSEVKAVLSVVAGLATAAPLKHSPTRKRKSPGTEA